MSYSNTDFTVKFFRPPQRTVSCHNGLLNTRTKHTVARDRLIVAEQRMLDVERRKSASHLQLIAFEQKQLEKRLSSLHSMDPSLQIRHRSTSEANLHQMNGISEMTHSKLHASLNQRNQNLLSLLKTDHFPRDKDLVISDPESGDEESAKSIRKKPTQLPTVAVIPPDEDNFFLLQ